MEIYLNGSAHSVPESTTLQDLIESLNLPDKGVAIAINSEVMPKSRWKEISLSPRDKVELLTIAQGG